MKITRESSSAVEVILSIEMDAEDEEPFINRSYRRTVSRLNIPGFRKGKAPRSIVESYVGRAALVQEALDFMVPEVLNQVLQSEEIQAFVEPRIEVTELEPVSFTATVPLEPMVDLGSFYEARLEKEPDEVTDEEVERVLEQLRAGAAPWEPVARPAQFGDLLNLNMAAALDGEELAREEGADYRLQEENVLPFPGFAPYLVGMQEGEQKSFTVIVPEDYPRPEFAGKGVDFQVEVLSIKGKTLPELDDEFAKSVSDGYPDLDTLRAAIYTDLVAAAERYADRDLEERSIASLLECATIEASPLLLQREVESMEEEREQLLRNRQLDMDSYLAYVGKTSQELQDEMLPAARQRLNRSLALRKLAQQEEIDVTPDEIAEEIDRMIADGSAEDTEPVRSFWSSQRGQENIRSSLFSRKLTQRFLEIVQGLERGALAEEQPPLAPAEAVQAEEGSRPPASPAADLDTPASPADPVPAETEGTEEGAKPDAV